MNATAAVLVKPRHYDLREFPMPKLSSDDGLIRVEACGMCGSDYWQYVGVEDQNGGRPLIPGHEIYGVVEALGSDAGARWGLKVGQRVLGRCRKARATVPQQYSGKDDAVGMASRSPSLTAATRRTCALSQSLAIACG